MAAFNASADITADWKQHMPFDAWPTQIIETPTRVYFMNRTFENNPNLAERSIPSHSLFYYDKKGDEIISVNARATASGNAVATMAYSTDGYLLVVYTDCNIDFIYDDGRVFNLPALKVTSIPGKKEAYNITFDNARKRAYVATSFGYICLNSEKHEVAESRIYGVPLSSVARCGDNIVLVDKESTVYYAPASANRFNLQDEYKEIKGFQKASVVIPLPDSNDFFTIPSGAGTLCKAIQDEEGAFSVELVHEDPNYIGLQQIPGGGYRLCGNVSLFEIGSNGNFRRNGDRQQDIYRIPATSYNGTELWVLESRKGIRSYKLDQQWNLTLSRDYMRPNAPAVYISSSMLYHPTYGMLTGSNGVDVAFSSDSQQTPANVSALKGNFWKEYGQFYATDPSIAGVTNYFGLSRDPQNPNHIYRGSMLGGFMRMNLADPNQVLIFANPSNSSSKQPGFIKIREDMQVWNILCRFTTPQFDSNGTMWTLHNNRDMQRNELWFWPAADRTATVSAATYRPMKQIEIPYIVNSNNDQMIALQQNKNMLVVSSMGDEGSILVYDTRGTLDTPADDRYVVMKDLHDQDGGGVNFLLINNMMEDPATGLVWIMTQRGLFTMNPAQAFENPNQVNRIKVARNDGTNLADYLLNEINVNHMSIDGEGRKWFSTSNGLVCTSQDGRQILGEFSTSNSYLPGNNVYATCFNPESNSLMVATEGGLIEMFPSGTGGSSASDDSGIRAYPNPVEPDFYGWVRIDNIADGSLVKITDSRGGIVKELGPVQGGSVQWDVSGLNNTRVATGVYYIMVSPGSNSQGKTQIAKILVLN